MKAIILVPTCRPKDCLWFLKEWKEEFKNHQVFVIEDSPKKTFKIKDNNVRHYCWKDIDKDLGDKAWIINRNDCSIWSYGAYKAWQENPDMVVVLSDDCYPVSPEDVGSFLNRHWEKLNKEVSISWLNPCSGFYPRGYPYGERNKRVILNMGLWGNVPDIDSITQLKEDHYIGFYDFLDLVVPKGTYFALSDMNTAYKPEFTPYVYEFASNRYGDIWMGIRMKRFADKYNYAITIGSPYVEHIRASNPFKNIKKEAIHLEENETFWKNPIPKRYKRKIDTWMSLFQ